MGLEVHKGGFKSANDLELADCGSLCGIDVHDNLLVQLKERLEAP